MSSLFDVDEWKQLPSQLLFRLVHRYITGAPADITHNAAAMAMVHAIAANIQRPGDAYTTLQDLQDKGVSFGELVDAAQSYLTKRPAFQSQFPSVSPLPRPLVIPGLGAISQIPKAPARPVEIPSFMYSNNGFTVSSVQEYISTSGLEPNPAILRKVLTTKAYGDFDVSDLLYIYQVPLDVVRKSFTRANVEPIYAIVQIIERARAAIATFEAKQRVLAAEMKRGTPIPDILENPQLKDSVVLVGGLPVVQFTFDNIDIRGGIGGLKIPPHKLIGSISRIPTVIWSEAYSGTREELIGNARKVAWVVATSKIPPITLRPDQDYSTAPLTDIYATVLNLPEIYAPHSFGGMDHFGAAKATLSSIHWPRTLSPGGHQALLRYLDRNPNVNDVILRPRGHPYAIEDYIIEDVWRTLPIEIRRTTGPVKIVDNPYLLIPDFRLLAIAGERSVSVEFETAASTLYALDQIEPDWSQVILRKSIYELTWPQAYYYMAARGIRFPYYEVDHVNMQELHNTFAITVPIQDAGGLGVDEKDARPNRVGFLTDEIKNLRPMYIEMICHAFNIPDFELVTPTVLRRIVERGFINPLPLEPQVAARHEIWKGLTPLQKAMLSRLYKVERIDVGQFTSTQPPIQSVEHYILAYKPEYVDTFIHDLEMVVPNHVSKEEYLTSSLHLYDAYLKRATAGTFVVEELSDFEILLRLRAWIAYDTREQLVERAKYYIQGGVGFFIPFERHCVNVDTFDYVYTTKDPNIFLVSYGSLQTYYCYTIFDMRAGLEPTEEGIYRYRLPLPNEENKPQNFQQIPREVVGQAATLVRDWQDQLIHEEDRMEAKDFLLNIVRINDVFERGTVYDAEQFKLFIRLPLEVRPLIQQLLHQIFELGMYARRWRGPPNPYPLTDKETWMDQCFVAEAATATPVDRVLDTMAQIGGRPRMEEKIIDPKTKKVTGVRIHPEMKGVYPPALTWFMNLHVVEHIDGKINQSATQPFSDLWSKQYGEARGHTCIRIGSRFMIGTGHYYLQLFFKETIPHYDPTKLEKIV